MEGSLEARNDNPCSENRRWNYVLSCALWSLDQGRNKMNHYSVTLSLSQFLYWRLNSLNTTKIKRRPQTTRDLKPYPCGKNDPRFATRGIRNRTGLLTPDCDGTLRSLGHRVVNTKESENLVRAEKS